MFLFVCIMALSVNLSVILAANKKTEVFQLVNLEGKVNKSEIGGEALYVVSLWDSRGNFPVSEDGSFTTVVSNQRPQKISLEDDKKKIRALAIVLPQSSKNIIFDAKSTALAVLFQDASSFGQSSEVEQFMGLAESSSSFQDLVAYLKKNLSDKSLDELNKLDQYAELLDACNSQIKGDDQKQIKDSLNAAKQELEKVLP